MNNNELNNNPYYQNEAQNAPVKKKASGLSIAALVLGIIAFVNCFLFINIPLGIISIILAVIALAKKHGGKGMSIAGIVLSLLSFAVSLLVITLIMPLIKAMPGLYDDLNRLYGDDYDAVIEEYDRTGQLPEYMDEYYEGELGDFFDQYYGGFDNFFDEVIRRD